MTYLYNGISTINDYMQKHPLATISFTSQLSHVWIAYGRQDMTPKNIFSAYISGIQTMLTLAIYKDYHDHIGYNQNQFYALGITTLASSFYELYNENYNNMVASFVIPSAVILTTILAEKKYNNAMDTAIKYAGGMLTATSVGIYAKDIYDVVSQWDLDIISIPTVGGALLLMISLSLPESIAVFSIGTAMFMLSSWINSVDSSQQVTASDNNQQHSLNNEKSEEMTGLIQNISQHQHDEF